MHNIETPRGPHWNIETVYIHNKALTLKNSQSHTNGLDEHRKKTDNTMLQLGGTKGWSIEEAALPNNWLICFLARWCHPSSGQATPPENIPGHSGISEYGTVGISVRHCWQGARRRVTNGNRVLSLASHQLMLWLPLGAWWTFLGENKTYKHLEEVVTHSCCPTPVFKLELINYSLLSEYGAWEPNPPLFCQKESKCGFSAQTTNLTHRSLTAAGKRRGLIYIKPLKWLHCAENFLTSEREHKGKYKSVIWGLVSCLGGSRFSFSVIQRLFHVKSEGRSWVSGLPALSQLLDTVLKPGRYNTVLKVIISNPSGPDLYMKYLPRYSGRGRTELKQVYTVQNILNSQIWEAISISSTHKRPDASLVRWWLSGSFQSCNSVPSPRWHVQGLPRHNLLPKSCLPFHYIWS